MQIQSERLVVLVVFVVPWGPLYPKDYTPLLSCHGVEFPACIFRDKYLQNCTFELSTLKAGA